MALFKKFKEGLQKTHTRLVHEIKRIVTLSPRLTGSTLEELEAALLGADLGTGVTQQILADVKKAYETQGRSGEAIFEIAQRAVERSLSSTPPHFWSSPAADRGFHRVNGTGKTTTAPSSRISSSRKISRSCSPHATPSAPPPWNSSNSGASG
jgi:signal recognition particle GTPase